MWFTTQSTSSVQGPKGVGRRHSRRHKIQRLCGWEGGRKHTAAAVRCSWNQRFKSLTSCWCRETCVGQMLPPPQTKYSPVSLINEESTGAHRKLTQAATTQGEMRQGVGGACLYQSSSSSSSWSPRCSLRYFPQSLGSIKILVGTKLIAVTEANFALPPPSSFHRRSFKSINHQPELFRLTDFCQFNQSVDSDSGRKQ